MKAIVTYVSKSGNSAILSVAQPIPGTKLMNRISGFIGIEENGYEVGEVIDLPDNLSVSKEVRKSTPNAEFGDSRDFEWLVFGEKAVVRQAVQQPVLAS